MDKKIVIELNAPEVDEIVTSLATELEGCAALYEGQVHRNHPDHLPANIILNKLVDAGATRESFHGWGRRWDEAKREAREHEVKAIFEKIVHPDSLKGGGNA